MSLFRNNESPSFLFLKDIHIKCSCCFFYKLISIALRSPLNYRFASPANRSPNLQKYPHARFQQLENHDRESQGTPGLCTYGWGCWKCWGWVTRERRRKHQDREVGSASLFSIFCSCSERISSGLDWKWRMSTTILFTENIPVLSLNPHPRNRKRLGQISWSPFGEICVINSYILSWLKI